MRDGLRDGYSKAREARQRQRERAEQMTPEEREAEQRAYYLGIVGDANQSKEDRKIAAVFAYGWDIVPDAVLDTEYTKIPDAKGEEA